MFDLIQQISSNTATVESVQELINDGEDVNAEQRGNTALLILCDRRIVNETTLQILNILVDHGADVNYRNTDDLFPESTQNSPLHQLMIGVMDEYKLRAIQKLLSAGANANIRNKENMTPLMYYIYLHSTPDTHDAEVARLLIEGGTDPRAMNYEGTTAYEMYMLKRNFAQNDAVVKILKNDSIENRMNYVGKNLRGQNMSGGDYSGADFTGANLTGAQFIDANLTNAIFSHVILSDTDFTGAIMNHAYIFRAAINKNTKFNATNLSQARISTLFYEEDEDQNEPIELFNNTNFQNAIIANTHLYHIDINGCNFENAAMIGIRAVATQFLNCNMAHSFWSAFNSVEALMFDCNMDSITMTGRSDHALPFQVPAQLVIEDSKMTNAYISNMNFENFGFVNVDMTNSNLDKSQFIHGSFIECNMYNVRLYINKFHSVEFDHVMLNGVNFERNSVNECDFIEPTYNHIVYSANVENPMEFFEQIHIPSEGNLLNGADVQENDNEEDDEDDDDDEDEEDEEEIVIRQGVAFDVHNAASSVSTPLLLQVLKKHVSTRKKYRKQKIANYFCGKINDILSNNPRFTTEERETQSRKANEVCHRFRHYRELDNKHAKIIGYCIDYVLLQDEIFQQLYVDTFITDCRQAYNGDDDSANTMSCMGGVYERTYLSIYKAIEQRLLSVGDFPLTDDKKREYEVIAATEFNTDFLLQSGREWLNSTTIPVSKVDRVASLRQYIVDKMSGWGLTLGRKENKKLDDFLEYAFEESGEENFGGGRKGGSKKQQNNKTKKHRKHQGNNKTKILRKGKGKTNKNKNKGGANKKKGKTRKTKL